MYRPGAPEGKVDVIAHRGASAYAPENTLASFALAADLRANWFELDCTLSRDNEIVVIHDNSIDRTTDGKGRVAQLNWEEIRSQDAGSWFDPKFKDERIPSLREALELAKKREIGVYIEIKDSDDDTKLRDGLSAFADNGVLLPGHAAETMAVIEASRTRNLELTRRVIKLVRDLHMTKQVVIQSFSPIVCTIVLVEAPEIRTELLASSSDKDPKQWAYFMRWLRLIGPAGFNVNKGDVTEDLIRDLHAEGKTIAVWTVDDEGEMSRLAHMGVDAIITNKPDAALELLALIDR
jgi:glycerophosphoryl diester phosphodiesterase